MVTVDEYPTARAAPEHVSDLARYEFDSEAAEAVYDAAIARLQAAAAQRLPAAGALILSRPRGPPPLILYLRDLASLGSVLSLPELTAVQDPKVYSLTLSECLPPDRATWGYEPWCPWGGRYPRHSRYSNRPLSPTISWWAACVLRGVCHWRRGVRLRHRRDLRCCPQSRRRRGGAGTGYQCDGNLLERGTRFEDRWCRCVQGNGCPRRRYYFRLGFG